MAGTAIRKLRMTELDVHVVLGGGIFRNRFAPFFDRIDDGIRQVATTASLKVLEAPPVLGAALLGLDHLGASGREKARLQGRLDRRIPRPQTRTREAGVTMAKIVLDGVTKVFGNEVVAVDDVSLEIGDGEFMVLVGPPDAASPRSCGSSPVWRR